MDIISIPASKNQTTILGSNHFTNFQISIRISLLCVGCT